MPSIELRTEIRAEINLVFDLNRSIDLHKISTSKTKEEAIDGKRSGLIGLNETVTWRAKHLGFYQELTSIISGYDRPYFFEDRQLKGIFKSFKHQHRFKSIENGTEIIDVIDYCSPLGFLGKLADLLFLKAYLKRFLEERNAVIKEYAESEKWKLVLEENDYRY